MTSTQPPFEFFYEHAGYSYDPQTQTPEQGRIECAKALAEAERWAAENNYYYEWDLDDIDSSYFNDDPAPYAQYVCIMRDPNDQVVQALGGVDFGRDGEPDAYQPYRRVIEAELALEAKAQQER